ncbi:hypothetical protein, partial [Accumulibacter sp.]|uniref:hypothetical protein n=1 Tax=Accumulibacter sp. TaxID=2053492 RepID=UPI0025CFCB19
CPGLSWSGASGPTHDWLGVYEALAHLDAPTRETGGLEKLALGEQQVGNALARNRDVVLENREGSILRSVGLS